jgi:hypothetical protein
MTNLSITAMQGSTQHTTYQTSQTRTESGSRQEQDVTHVLAGLEGRKASWATQPWHSTQAHDGDIGKPQVMHQARSWVSKGPRKQAASALDTRGTELWRLVKGGGGGWGGVHMTAGAPRQRGCATNRGR